MMPNLVKPEATTLSPDAPVDLTNCDREPIHIPGAVQPHGVLLVLREPDLAIVQVSANAGACLGAPPDRLLGRRLDELLGPEQTASVLDAIGRGEPRGFRSLALELATSARVVDGAVTRRFGAVVHRSDGVVILELEPEDGTPPLSADQLNATVQRTLSHVEHAETLSELA
ncbi:MAG: hypothetical protein JO180_02445, partial [Gemmatirosa sp.]|nr:hypothetical protein [Gemmatirosa sp.]